MDSTSPKPRGRPKLDPTDDTVDLNVRLPARQYDELYASAQRARCSVPELVRRLLRDGRRGESNHPSD